MKKHLLIELSLVIVFLGVGFWNIRQQHDVLSLRETVQFLKEEQKGSKEKEQRLLSENERLSDEAKAVSESLKEIRQKYVNAGTNVDLNSEFINIVTKLFEANLNFTPENYNDKKKEVSSYLSEELRKKYFGQERKTYQDANGTSSKLESISVYIKSSTNGALEGVAIVYYRSKKDNQGWINGMTIFKVTYTTESKQITEIVNLGNGPDR